MNVPVNTKIGRKLDSPGSKSTVDIATTDRRASNLASQHDSRTSIHINNVIGAGALATQPAEATEPVVLGTPAGDNVIPPDSLIIPPLALSTTPRGCGGTFGATSKFEVQEDEAVETINDNVELQRFRAIRTDALLITCDVRFLKHVIKVLITNHNVITTPGDLQDILEYFGDTEIRTERQAILTRSPKKSGGCCSADEVQQFIDVITKILIQGVNIAKKAPAFLDFLGELGLSI